MAEVHGEIGDGYTREYMPEDFELSEFQHSNKGEKLPSPFQKAAELEPFQADTQQFRGFLDSYPTNDGFGCNITKSQTISQGQQNENRYSHANNWDELFGDDVDAFCSERCQKVIKMSDSKSQWVPIQTCAPVIQNKKDPLSVQPKYILYYNDLRYDVFVCKSKFDEFIETVVNVFVKNLPKDIENLHYNIPKNFHKRHGDRFLADIKKRFPQLRALQTDSLNGKPAWNAVFDLEKRREILSKPQKDRVDKERKLMEQLNANQTDFPPERMINIFLQFAENFNSSDITRPEYKPEENAVYEVLSNVIRAAATAILKEKEGEFISFEMEKVHKKEGIFKYRTTVEKVRTEVPIIYPTFYSSVYPGIGDWDRNFSNMNPTLQNELPWISNQSTARLTNSLPYGDSKPLRIEQESTKQHWMSDGSVYQESSQQKIDEEMSVDLDAFLLKDTGRGERHRDPAVHLDQNLAMELDQNNSSPFGTFDCGLLWPTSLSFDEFLRNIHN